ncbi:peptidyl-prolyl cis-trans isomerase [Vibrio ponticus]|nr:peptidyl-prolyl cis-trans isomerase [Vibrio ponticus]
MAFARPYMKKHLLPSLIISFLFGCSADITNSTIDATLNHSGGQSMGEATSLYWFTDRLAIPLSAADYVVAGDYGWYQSNYRWEEGRVRELIREGEQLKGSQGLVPYTIHVRFNQQGEAVYQMYRLDGKVLPLKNDMLEQLQGEAVNVAEKTKQLEKEGMELIQGYWDGREFETCSGAEYHKLEFNQSLPSFVVDRLAGIDSFVAFVGRADGDSLVIEDLLMLTDDSQSCIARPQLLEN